MSAKQTPESFWARVDVRGDSECWEWQGCCNNTGYGTVGWHGSTYVAHRVAAWLEGMVVSPAAPKSGDDPGHVLHRCDNRKCCNFKEHFFLGTFSDNQLDAYAKGRKKQPRGEHHANAKLTYEQAAKIRERYAAGELQVPLSIEYDVSQRVISLIVRGETYK
jgi:hypothetical protein